MASLKKPTPRTLAALTGLPVQRGMRIGLLGGSFNPAHEGHVHITREALARLGLHQVWWLVSPRNPLKSKDDLAKLKKRVKEARKVMDHPAVHITRLEKKLGTRYTADTLERLVDLGSGVHFVWLMGADNLAQFHRWERWDWIMANVPIGVLARPGGRMAALNSTAARAGAAWRLPAEAGRALPLLGAPAWCFVNVPMVDISSTEIRARGGWR